MVAREGLSEKIAESIEHANEACVEDLVSGECVASWDEVEELSAASSHARNGKKDEDPSETYWTDECRTYEG
ncbi:chloroplast protein 12 precursor [Artemisia annua]|uniref:Chloroplast protein 12 n=1 Tax=Artemisia annua TaxID=35608 RepID=A0A2U1KMS1_ARTAN|nr:chloroplast protein 12 precursor [Artemisia annua]